MEFGDFVVFIGVGNIVFEYVIGGVVVVRGWIFYFVFFIFSGIDVGDRF